MELKALIEESFSFFKKKSLLPSFLSFNQTTTTTELIIIDQQINRDMKRPYDDDDDY